MMELENLLPLSIRSSWLVLLFIIVFLFTIIAKERKTRKKGEGKAGGLNLPPGSYGWPVLGESIEFIRTRNSGCSLKFIRERKDKYKSEVFKTSIFGESVVVLCGPAGNKFLFSNENKLVRLWWPASVKKLLGETMSTCFGVEGMLMRKMASYFFTPDAFTKLYIKTMDLASQRHLDTHWQGKEELEVYPAIKSHTFDLACRLFMSIEDHDLIEKLSALYRVFAGGVISIPFYFPGTKFYKAVKATAAIKKELLMIVRQRRDSLQQQTASPSQDLLSHLLVSPDENGGYMSESVIVNNILLMLFAGHGTSTSAITMLIKILAEHPDVYEKVLSEQEEIARTKTFGEYLQWEDVQRMRYSWNVVCETMRLWPPVIGAFREALTDISYGGYDIPKGWKFYWNASVTNGDSGFFVDNEKFDPSRFEGDGHIPFTYVPFGGGPRMCLGKEFARVEILTFLHNVVRRFRWSLVDPDEVLCDPIPRPVKGLPIRLTPRTQH